MGITVIPWTMAVWWVSLLRSPAQAWWYAVGWFRVVIWGTRHLLGIRMEVLGLEHLPAEGPVVLLCKHQSALETLWIPTLIPHRLAFVFKRELLQIPFFGWSMARLDMVHIDRSARAVAMKQVIEQGTRLLGQGTWIIMFPEGTRVPRGKAGTYQSAGVRLAVQAGATIVPVAVATARCWPKQGFCKLPGVVRVAFGQPIATQGQEPRELLHTVQAWIEGEMRRIDPEAYPDCDEAKGLE
ncbi:1-acyl-sn-glycerol-3-phosphate acyltransferase [Candidatus Symbiobacter mobilis CR]|uniref:1-acyl-sn-glycerol-3-phosphate acyltransferase n=2 Tax=Candidatus Symbiobacter TaxID=1436289 RepID=U5N5A5_9BURK|nr:1-acyl-sn-glycerol-3-phosphate acyltransferase [Candidatus Symbiobacter mobilis CR]